MSRVRRTHAPKFKARVALAALREDKTLAQLCDEFDLNANQISEWKRQSVERASAAFDDGAVEPTINLIPLHPPHATTLNYRDSTSANLVENIHGVKNL